MILSENYEMEEKDSLLSLVINNKYIPEELIAETQTLYELVSSGTIKLDVACNSLREKIIDAVQKFHKDKISEIQLKRGKIRYVTKITPPDGERKTLRADSLDELYLKLYQEIYGTIKHPNAYNLKDVYEKWFKTRCNRHEVRQNTLRRNDFDWRQYILPYKISDIRISKIKTKDVKDWGYSVINSKNVPMTCKAFSNIRGTLAGIIDYYIEEYNIINVNPVRNTTFPKHVFTVNQKDSSKIEVYYPDESREIIETSLRFARENNDELYLIFPIMLATGVRTGEAISLSFSDYNSVTSKLRIHRSFKAQQTIEFNKEGLEFHRTYASEDTLKRNTAERSIDTSFVVGDYFSEAKRILNSKGIKRDNLFSIKAHDQVFRRFKKVCAEIGIEDKGVYALRKTFASTLYYETKDVILVSRILGHSNPITSQNHYIFALQKEEEMKGVCDSIPYLCQNLGQPGTILDLKTKKESLIL